jgi:pyruvate dehydrogenase (quinone)
MGTYAERLTGMPYHDLIGTRTQQDVQLDKVFADVAEYSVRIMGPTHVENVAHLACRTALSRRGVAHITFPVDLQEHEIKGERSKRNVPGHTSDVLSQGARLPHEGDLAQAAGVLNEGEKIVILAGRGALHAGAELERIAELLGAPIVKAPTSPRSPAPAAPADSRSRTRRSAGRFWIRRSRLTARSSSKRSWIRSRRRCRRK